MSTAMPSKYSYISLDYLNMMSGGDETMREVMLQMLLEELPVEIAKMKPLADEANWTELKNVSHKMKSTLAFVGYSLMTEANRNIETSSKDGENLDEIPGWIAVLEDNLPKVMEELQAEYARS